ncbi:MAG: hypothetical protein RR869_04425 [Lachnospiraceae bacterium]
MEQNEKTPMTPLDQLVSSQELQTLKLLIPYTPPARQQFLAVYVKFMELQRTMSVFQNFGSDIHIQDFDREIVSPADMIKEMKPYLSANGSGTIEKVLNMMSMMELVSSFQTADTGDGINPLDMMKGMLTPEQQEMYQMYSTMFETEANMEKAQKGNDENGYECMDESPGNEKY